jgi:hypothetical protein
MTASIPGAQVWPALCRLAQEAPGQRSRRLSAACSSRPSFLLHRSSSPNGTGSVQLPIPNDKNFADAAPLLAGHRPSTSTNQVYGMTNGIDWLIGQQ